MPREPMLALRNNSILYNMAHTVPIEGGRVDTVIERELVS